MIEVNGKPVSEETVELALQEYFSKHPPKSYQFKQGDVVVSSDGLTRIIVYGGSNKMVSYAPNGYIASRNQQQFENAGYKKIGVISDYIK